MGKIQVIKFGLAFGLTGAIFYIGCTLVMLILGHDDTVKLFNLTLHGLDVSTIMKTGFSAVSELLGIVSTFILSSLLGGCIAAIYNILINKKSTIPYQ